MIHEVYEGEHVEVESDKEEHGEEGQDMEEAVAIGSKPPEPPTAQAEELSTEEEPLTVTHAVYEEGQVVESDKEKHGEEGQDMEEAVVIGSKPPEPPAAQAEELSAEEEPLTLTHPVHEEGQVEVESDKEEHGEKGQDGEEAVAIESEPTRASRGPG